MKRPFLVMIDERDSCRKGDDHHDCDPDVLQFIVIASSPDAAATRIRDKRQTDGCTPVTAGFKVYSIREEDGKSVWSIYSEGGSDDFETNTDTIYDIFEDIPLVISV